MDESRKSYAWNHYFFLYYGSESLDQDVRDMTGTWTVEANDDKVLCDLEEHRKVADSEKIAVRVLLHEVKSVQRQGTVDTISVEPKEKGFQMVDFQRLPELNRNLTFIFVNAKGQEIDRVTERDLSTIRRISRGNP